MLWLVFQEPEKCVVAVPCTPKPPELSQKEKNRLAREAWRLKRQVWVWSDNFCPLNSFSRPLLVFLMNYGLLFHKEKQRTWKEEIGMISLLQLILRFYKGLRLQIIFSKPDEKEPFWNNDHHPNPYIFRG